MSTLGLRRGKKKKQNNAEVPAPLPALNIPPPMPSGDLPALPNLDPLPLVEPSNEVQANPSLPATNNPLPAPAQMPDTANQTEDKYTGLWARKSDKPLQQIYGHIDRLSAGETGSLLDRYADRFGQDLDRDIIVLRKAEREELITTQRDAPVVELIQDEEDAVEYNSRLEEVEALLRQLKPTYEEAKASGDKEALAQIMPELKSLMAERKSLKGMNQIFVAQEDNSEPDLFPEFVGIVDNLLERDLPSDVVESFIASEEFDIYRQAGENPAGADDDLRAAFFQVVDNQLGKMPEDKISAFMQTDSFEIYKQIGAMYS